MPDKRPSVKNEKQTAQKKAAGRKGKATAKKS